jgi:hypothetical protein
MVLLFNVFLTNKSATGGQWERLGVGYNRGNLNTPHKLDILKYSLASYAVAFPWKRVIINVELDPDYVSFDKKAELKQYIHSIFKGFDLFYFEKRNLIQQDWIDTYELINDEMIFYQCNHDHIFIDNSTKYLEELVDLRTEYDDTITISTSHFPEIIRSAKCGYIPHDELYPSAFNKNYQIKDNHIFFEGKCLDSLIIITKKIFENWFIDGDWKSVNVSTNVFKSGQLELTRTEGTGIIGIGQLKEILGLNLINQKIIVPYKELFRHFDGYWHQKISNANCPAIDIPSGFFENKIKIRYGYDDYKDGWVNINPKNENYYAFNKNGVDYKITMDDIPLVWKNRISEIDVNSNIDYEEMIQYKLKSVLEMIYNSPKYNPYIDEDVKDKILSKYLETHIGYDIDIT